MSEAYFSCTEGEGNGFSVGISFVSHKPLGDAYGEPIKPIG